jgi:hypothetical protein
MVSGGFRSMGKYSTTTNFLSASWQIFKKEKTLIVFPLGSLICCLLIAASFGIPWLSFNQWQNYLKGQEPSSYLVIFFFYLCNYFVVEFFNAAIVACVMLRLGGGEPTVGYGIRTAIVRLPLISAWVLLSSTVGLILRIIGDHSETVNKIMVGLLGLTWELASYLVIPILVIDKKGPITALKSSAVLLKKTWGEQLYGSFGCSAIVIALTIPAFFAIAFGFIILIISGKTLPLIAAICLSVIYLFLSLLIVSALSSIFQAALYVYVRDGEAPAGFQAELFNKAMNRG